MKLNSDFTLDRYGLFVRLVNEEDANYIVKLRSDPHLGMYLSKTPNDVKKQKQWISDYKDREEHGLEYYFLFLHKNERIGVIRIYNIKDNTATSGSWICTPHLPFELPTLIVVIMREIFFEILQLETEYMDTRKNNKQVIKMHHLFGAHKTSENEIDVFHYLTKEDFKNSKAKILKYTNVKAE